MEIVIGIVVFIAAALELGAAYKLKASQHPVGTGLVTGGLVSLCLGVLLILNHANKPVALTIIAIAQVVALVSLVLIVRKRGIA